MFLDITNTCQKGTSAKGEKFIGAAAGRDRAGTSVLFARDAAPLARMELLLWALGA
jgi:hypothetical protein